MSVRWLLAEFIESVYITGLWPLRWPLWMSQRLCDPQVHPIASSWSLLKVLLFRNILELIWERFSSTQPRSHFHLGIELDSILGAVLGTLDFFFLLETPSSIGARTQCSWFFFLPVWPVLLLLLCGLIFLDPLTKYHRPSSFYLSLHLLSLFILPLGDFINSQLQVPSRCIWVTHFYLQLRPFRALTFLEYLSSSDFPEHTHFPSKAIPFLLFPESMNSKHHHPLCYESQTCDPPPQSPLPYSPIQSIKRFYLYLF